MSLTVFTSKYPPKNRVETPELGACEVEVSAPGTAETTVCLSTFTASDLAVAGVAENLPLPVLGQGAFISDISGAPAYRYATSEVQLHLTATEMYRLMRRNLEPAEYLSLRTKFGVFFEIHDDFYDEATGKAMQPRYSLQEADTFFQKCLRGEAQPGQWQEAIDEWKGQGSSMPLHQFLGMTEAEYEAVLQEPRDIYRVLFERLRDFGAADVY